MNLLETDAGILNNSSMHKTENIEPTNCTRWSGIKARQNREKYFNRLTLI